MLRFRGVSLAILLAFIGLVTAQQECYYGPGAEFRGPSNLVPCNGTGTSACCLLGDTCLSGNTCYDPTTGDLYQYGCTDIHYQDETCPYKCGWDPKLSPWTALEYCNEQDVADTWVCHSPESCGCQWNSTWDLLVLAPRGCQDMGSLARAALYAPSTLAPYVSLPSTAGGSTGYYQPTVISGTSTWISTAVAGYTPSSFTQLTTYRSAPTSTVIINAGVKPGPSTYAAAASYSGSAPSLPSTTAQGGSSGSSPSTTTTSSSSAAASTSASSSSGLSTGAKAGIGVGAGIGGLALIAAFGFCLVARRRWLLRNRQQPQQPGAPGQPQYSQVPQYGGVPPMQGMHPPQYGQNPGPGWAPSPGGGFHYQEGFKPAPVSPPSAPTELSADQTRDTHELDSVSGVSPQNSPSPGHPSPMRLPSS